MSSPVAKARTPDARRALTHLYEGFDIFLAIGPVGCAVNYLSALLLIAWSINHCVAAPDKRKRPAVVCV
jgi:hypothetical protein